MSHLIETMAYTNQVPWHGLGHYIAEAPTVDRMLKLAQLDWLVERQPIKLASGQKIEGFEALVRNTDKSLFDIVGSRYVPAQNREVFEFFKEFVEAGQATMETAGSLRGGRQVWGLAKLGKSFKLRGNDEVKSYLLASASHEQGRSNVFKMVATRVVCNNTITLALREKGSEHRVHHRAAFNEINVERAKEALGIAREMFGEFEVNARKLQKLKVPIAKARELLMPIFAPTLDEDSEDSPRLAKIMHALSNAPGADPGTGWGVLNATSYYTDHMAGTSRDRRLANAWFGKTARQKEKVLSLLLDMAG